MTARSPEPVVAIDVEQDADMHRNHLQTLSGLHRHGPMFFSPTGGHGKGMHVVTSYDLFREITRDPALFSNRCTNVAAPTPPQTGRPLVPQQLDPPEHSRYRKVLSPWFSSGAVDRLEPEIRAVCCSVLAAVEGRTEIDFVSDVARRYPGAIALALLGLPQDRLRELTDTTWEMSHLDETHDPGGPRRAAAAQRLRQTLTALVAERRARPTDDITGRLIRAGVDGTPFTDVEIVDVLFLLVLAGLDAVASQLMYTIQHLAEHPEHRAHITARTSGIDAVVEESLRCFASAPVSRVATETTTIGGNPVDADDRLYLNVVMANHDPTVFDQPDEFRVERSPNRHLAFGNGVHHCLGSSLARTEIRVFVEEWHRRFPDYRIAAGAVIVDSPLGVAALESLPLVLGESA